MPLPLPLPPIPRPHLCHVLPSSPGDIIDNLTRNGSFAFLEQLHARGDLFQLLDYRINLISVTGTVQDNFADCHKLILQLTVRFPKRSLPRRLLALVTRSLPSLLLPASRRGRPQHVTRNATRFLPGDWKELWLQALRLTSNMQLLVSGYYDGIVHLTVVVAKNSIFTSRQKLPPNMRLTTKDTPNFGIDSPRHGYDLRQV